MEVLSINPISNHSFGVYNELLVVIFVKLAFTTKLLLILNICTCFICTMKHIPQMNFNYTVYLEN